MPKMLEHDRPGNQFFGIVARRGRLERNAIFETSPEAGLNSLARGGMHWDQVEGER